MTEFGGKEQDGFLDVPRIGTHERELRKGPGTGFTDLLFGAVPVAVRDHDVAVLFEGHGERGIKREPQGPGGGFPSGDCAAAADQRMNTPANAARRRVRSEIIV